MGPQLGRIVLKPFHSLRGSGDNPKTFFPRIKQHRRAISRNAFGRPFIGSMFPSLGLEPHKEYVACMDVLGMGDLNAVDIAQQCHEEILKSFGCMRESIVLRYGSPFPLGELWEGLYIDDHVVIAMVPTEKLHALEYEDIDIVRRSHQAYAAHGLPRSLDKAFGFSKCLDEGTELRASSDFIVWGSEVSSARRSVATPLAKRRHLFLVSAKALAMGALEPKLLQKWQALFIHPMMHKK